MNFEEYEQKIVDRFSNVQHSLWNALITLNSVFIAVVALLLPEYGASKVRFGLMFAIPVISIIMIIINYKLLLWLYNRIMKTLSQCTSKGQIENVEKDGTFANKLYKSIRILNWIIQSLVLIEFSLITTYFVTI